MWKWIQTLFSENDRETHQKKTAPAINITLNSRPKPQNDSVKLNCAATRKLWKEIRGISHGKYPFLDQDYSPSSNMPAADFSPWVTSRLAENDWDAIQELLSFMTYNHMTTGLLKTFRNYTFAKFLNADDNLLNELKAVALLTFRIQSTGHQDNTTNLLSNLFCHILTNHHFVIRPEMIPHLLEGANRFLKRQNKTMKTAIPLVTAAVLQKAGMHPINTVIRTLAKYPVTFRSCLAISMQRDKRIPYTIRPRMGGYYGQRQFGLSIKQNEHFLDDCDLFEPPSDVKALANRLTKDNLMKIAADHKIEVTKSWKKPRLIDTIISDSSTHRPIFEKTSGEMIQIKDEYRNDFDEWLHLISELKFIALCLACA